jgi:hypothetical protein
MSRFQSSILRRWWDEEEESDDDDFFFIGAFLDGLKRKKPGRHNILRDILGGHDRIHLDYFSDRCVYGDFGCRRPPSCG